MILTNKAAEQVALALDLIERGELSLEKGPERFGENWPAMLPAIKMSLQVNLASNPPLVSTRPYVAPDLKSGWQSLQAQLEMTPQLPAPPRIEPVVHPLGRLWAGVRRFFATKPGQALGGSLIGLALSFFLVVGVAEAKPGDLLWRARLGWEFAGEILQLDPDQKAEVALKSADNRLAELESMAFAASPDQLTEVQGQYLRAVDAASKYSNYPQFHSYVALYDTLTDQRDRVERLQQAEYAFGPGARLTYLEARLNDAVFTIAPKIPVTTPPPNATPGSGPATPTAKP